LVAGVLLVQEVFTRECDYLSMKALRRTLVILFTAGAAVVLAGAVWVYDLPVCHILTLRAARNSSSYSGLPLQELLHTHHGKIEVAIEWITSSLCQDLYRHHVQGTYFKAVVEDAEYHLVLVEGDRVVYPASVETASALPELIPPWCTVVPLDQGVVGTVDDRLCRLQSESGRQEPFAIDGGDTER